MGEELSTPGTMTAAMCGKADFLPAHSAAGHEAIFDSLAAGVQEHHPSFCFFLRTF
jgi:hypothetical protein